MEPGRPVPPIYEVFGAGLPYLRFEPEADVRFCPSCSWPSLSGVQHVPFISEHPANCRQFAAEHAPFEISPRAQFFWVTFFCRFHGGNHPVPYFVNDHSAPLFGCGGLPNFPRDPLLSAALDSVDDAPLAAVPNLRCQLILGFNQLREWPELLSELTLEGDLFDQIASVLVQERAKIGRIARVRLIKESSEVRMR